MNKGESYEKTFLKLLAVSMLVGCITACGDDPVKDPGTYKEKLDISIHNLALNGSNHETIIIECDSLYESKDESGFIHENDATATVALRDDAISSSIEGITISNFWNSQAIFDEKLGANYSEHIALALLVQADQFVMENDDY